LVHIRLPVDTPVPVERVWEAFADPEIKRQWFGSPEFSEEDRREDFRVGGVAIHDGRRHDDPLSQFRATYTDIVPHQRIVYSYEMWLDDVHASTSITTIVFEPSGKDGHPGTRLTFTEQGVHLDDVHGPDPQAAAGVNKPRQACSTRSARCSAPPCRRRPCDHLSGAIRIRRLPRFSPR
jgi:uncharacterized protein YndB with AHSA1/START domain